MDYLQARDAVWDAFQHGDTERGNTLLEEYLSELHGEELGRGLSLKASVIATFVPSRTTEGLAVIDEALPLLRRNPLSTAIALKVALAMIYVSGDADRAQPYEEAACRLLLEYGNLPDVRAQRPRLQLNLGMVASLRGDYATTYWYLVQAANSLAVPELSPKERQHWEFRIQTEVALSCLRVRRFYEAQEALDLAEACSSDHPHRLRLPIFRAELWRRMGLTEEANKLLCDIAEPVATINNSDIATWYEWISALVAHDLGDVPGYHKHLSKAQELAVEHHFDYLLGEIQRFGRSANPC